MQQPEDVVARVNRGAFKSQGRERRTLRHAGRHRWWLSGCQGGQVEEGKKRQDQHTTAVTVPLHQGSGTRSTATKFPRAHSKRLMRGSASCSDTIRGRSVGSVIAAASVSDGAEGPRG